MDIVGLLIALIVFVAIASIVCWFVSKASLPQPISFVVYAVLAIIGILVLVGFSGYGHVAIR